MPIITKSEPITRGEALRLTRKLYRGLATAEVNRKPKWTKKYVNCCPLCHYVQILTSTIPGDTDTVEYCIAHCPMSWPRNKKGNHVCYQNGGLWAKWKNADPEKAKKLAKQIAELPRKRIKK